MITNLPSTAIHRALSTLAVTVASCVVAACAGGVVPSLGSQVVAPTIAEASPSPAYSAAPSPTIAPFMAVVSSAFKPTLTLPMVPSTWRVDDDTLGTFNLSTGSPLLATDGSPSAVYVLTHGMIHPAGCGDAVDIHQDAKRMLATLVGLPGLVSSQPRAITLAGRRGFVVEVHVAPTWKEACVGTTPGVQLLHSLPPTSDPSFDDGIGVGTLTAIYLLDRPEGGVMIIQIDDQSGGHDLAADRAVVETMRLAP
jgi:hypothetical protein